MAFTLTSATVITQTGTDTTLNGIRNFAGVTVSGGLAFGQKKRVYTLDNIQLIVEGNLTIDPDFECLLFEDTCPYPNLDYQGTLQIGVRDVSTEGVVRYSTGDAIICCRRASQSYNAATQGGITTTVNGSSFIGYGGNIVTASPVAFCGSNTSQFTGSVLIESLGYFAFVCADSQTAQLRFDNALGESVNVVGLELDSSMTSNTTARSSMLFATDFTTFSATFKALSVQSFAGQLKGLRFDNLSFKDNFRNFDLVSNGGGETLCFVDTDTGSATSIVARNTSGNMFAFLANLSLKVKDLSANGISGAKYYFIDVDDGLRQPAQGDTSAITAEVANINAASPTVYSSLTDANGDVSELVLLSAWNAGNAVQSYYSAGGSSEDSMNVGICDYLYTLDLSTVVFPVAQVDRTLFIDANITEQTKATVEAYTVLADSPELYDFAKSYLFDNYEGQGAAFVLRGGSLINAGAYDVNIDATAASVFSVVGNTITFKSTQFTGDMITTGIITLSNGAVFNGSRTDANGTIAPPKIISISGLVTGSRIELFNVTTGLETVNEIVPGTVYAASYAEGVDYSTGDAIRIRVTSTSGLTAKKEYGSSVVAGSTGFTAFVAQEEDEVYDTIGIDGSTITQFSADYVADDVIVTVSADFTIADFYAWWTYNTTTELGIRNFFGGVTAQDVANFRINIDIVNIFLDSNINVSVKQTDNRRIYRDDDTYPVRQPTTSGYGLDVVWRNLIFVVATGTSGLTPSESAQLAEITSVKGKTDLLNFTGDDIKATLDGEVVTTDTVSRDASKADVSGLSTFNPVQDTVANVDIVNTVTTNTDMRGTDGAITSVAGLSTFNVATDQVITDLASRNASKADVSSLSTFNPATDTVANVTLVDAVTVNADMRGTDGAVTSLAGISTFNVATESVITDTASREASKADVADLTLKVDELHLIRGLSLGSAATFTPESIAVGGISLTITGDGETTSTVTRNA